eukprot:10885710-Alexandrium_andersonii.AAC.1
MSASLVGSEMCIRDRGGCGEAVERWSGGGGYAVGMPREGRGEARGGHGAVSYTHLTLPTICSV